MLLFNDYFWSGLVFVWFEIIFFFSFFHHRLVYFIPIFMLHKKLIKLNCFFFWIIEKSKNINIVFVASSVGVGRLGTDRTEIEMVLVF